MARGDWLNTEKRVWRTMFRPCWGLGYCPYGQLVEEFPFTAKGRGGEPMSCDVFGHDCPCYYLAEPMAERKPHITKRKVAMSRMAKCFSKFFKEVNANGKAK